MDDDVDLPVVINNNYELRSIHISVAMWFSLIIGMLIGACVCGFADQLSNAVDFMNFIEVNISWRAWLVLITILSILFLMLESKYRARIEV